MKYCSECGKPLHAKRSRDPPERRERRGGDSLNALGGVIVILLTLLGWAIMLAGC